jgi:uncharacterized protein YkwD
MNRAKIFFGGILAALSMSAAPALAKPAIRIDAEGGYRAPSKLSYEVELENRVLELVNGVRNRRGLPEMRFDFRGQRAARALVVEAAREGSFFDISKGVKQRLADQGIDATHRETGEIKAVADADEDIDTLARRIVRSWLKNPRQSRVLLSDELTYAGVGAVIDRDNDLIVVLDAFGADRTPPPAPHCGTRF